jgi:hypothetical protein
MKNAKSGTAAKQARHKPDSGDAVGAVRIPVAFNHPATGLGPLTVRNLQLQTMRRHQAATRF